MSGENHEKETKSHEEFRLGDFYFSLKTKELKNDKGETIHLRSQSADVLAYLSQHHGKLVSKSKLMDVLWAETFVTDDSLVQCIADIRRALNDNDHKIVQTSPKKGYKLDAEPISDLRGENLKITESLTVPTAGFSISFTRLALFGLVAMIALGVAIWRFEVNDFDPVDPSSMNLPIPQIPSIAILAFDDHSTGNDRDYLSDAIAEGIIAELSRFKELFVIARNSSFSFREAPTDVRRISQRLGVRYLLEGSQQKIKDRLRVTVQLIDAIKGNHLWSEVYERDLNDLFVVQDDIVRRVVATVAQKLIKIEGEKSLKSDGSKLSSLHNSLKARQYSEEYTREGNEKARIANLDAIKADPTQPYGYIGLTFVYINGYRWGWTDLTRADALNEARKAAQKALELAPHYYDSYVAMAYFHMQEGDLDRAIARFYRALELNPNDTISMSNLAEAFGYAGRSDEAEKLLIKAMRLDPLHPDWIKWNLAWVQWLNGNCDHALLTMNDISKMPPFAYRMLAVINICLGRKSQAASAIERLQEHYPDYSIAEVRQNFLGKYKNNSDLERYLNGLREAGLPE